METVDPASFNPNPRVTRMLVVLALTLTACMNAPDADTDLEGSTAQGVSITSTQFQWIPATTATGIQHATPAIGGAAGLFGASGFINVGFFPVTLPVGTRITKLGVRLRHASGESPGGSGAVVLASIYRSGGNIQGDNNVELLPASPPASNPFYSLTIGGSATPTWEEKIVTLDSSRNLITGSYTYVIAVDFSGPILLEAVGYEYVPRVGAATN